MEGVGESNETPLDDGIGECIMYHNVPNLIIIKTFLAFIKCIHRFNSILSSINRDINHVSYYILLHDKAFYEIQYNVVDFYFLYP